MKIKLGIFILGLLLLSNIASAQISDMQLSAKSAVLIDAFTGRVFYNKNADEKHYPASITKIMTLIVALERGNLNDVVTVGENAPNTEGSSIYLEAGQRILLRDLLYGMMLKSGNDATIAVAEHLSGSMPAFVNLMNEKAQAIGCQNTHFVNPNGLPDDRHYSTAADMARITAYGYRYNMFEKIVSTEKYVIYNDVRGEYQELFNENKMLWRYEGCNGVKTGYTERAGHCLVVGAKRYGIQLIAVVMDADEKWDDTEKLLDYGFSCLEPRLLFKSGTEFGKVRLKNGESATVNAILASDMVYPALKNSRDNYEITYKCDLPLYVNTPVKKGQQLGTLKVFCEGRQITTVPLVADRDVDKKSLFFAIWQWMSSIWKKVV